MALPVIQLILYIGIGVFSLVFAYYKYAHTYWKRRGVPTLEASFPFGNMGQVITQKQSMADKIYKVYMYFKLRRHKYCGLYFFSRKVFLPLDPELVKNILCKDFQHFNDRGIYYDEKNDPVSAHLFSLAGPKWKNLRTKLTPAFTGGKVKYMFHAMYDCADEMVAKLISDAKIDRLIEIKDILARYTTDVIGSCAFGIECNSIKYPDAEFRLMGKRAFTQTAKDAFKMVIIRSFPGLASLLRLGVFPPSVSKFFRDMVERTVGFREKNNITRNDFLQLLIQLKNRGSLDESEEAKKGDPEPGAMLTMDEAAAQAFIFFLAGFETTSTTMSFALLEMAINTDYQERARQEVLQVLESHENVLSYEAILDLKYLDLIVCESLRKYPPAPVFLRKCTKDYQVPGTNITIEKGLSVLIPAIALHRDPEYFPNPDCFDPERFNEENKKKIRDYTYIPFGEGPRICIGSRFAMVQSKLALALILKNFKFKLSERTPLPLQMETKGIILSPLGGIWLNMERLTN